MNSMASFPSVEFVGNVSSEAEFDAALKTVSQYGFSKITVKRTLRNMLNVYGGENCWPLIKENGYEVVIERLLLDQEKKCCKKVKVSQAISTLNGSQLGTKQEDKSLRVGLKKENRRQEKMETLLLDTPFLQLECSDVYLHQKHLWTKEGSLLPPLWFKEDGACNDKVHQNFGHLHTLLNNCLISRESETHIGLTQVKTCEIDGAKRNVCDVILEISTTIKEEELPFGLPHSLNSLDACAKFDLGPKVETTEETHCLQGRKSPKTEFSISKNQGIKTPCDNVSMLSVEGCSNKAASFTNDASALGISSTEDRVSSSAFEKIEERCSSVSHFLADAIDTSNECCEGDAKQNKCFRDQKLADGSATTDLLCDNYSIDMTGTAKNDNQHVIVQHLKRKRLSIQDPSHDADMCGSKSRGCFRENGNQTSPSTINAIKKETATSSSADRIPLLPLCDQSNLKILNIPKKQWKKNKYKFDIARMSASKLTRRRDGCPNPMFSRLQKCKQNATAKKESHNQADIEATSMPEKDKNDLEDVSAEVVRTKSVFYKEYGQVFPSNEASNEGKEMQSSLQRHSQEEPGEVASHGLSVNAIDLNILPGFCENSDLMSAQHSPDLPPGFSKPSDFPPGFNPPGDHTSCKQVMGEAAITFDSPEEHQGSMPPQHTADLPYGFGEPVDFPPGFSPPGVQSDEIKSQLGCFVGNCASPDPALRVAAKKYFRVEKHQYRAIGSSRFSEHLLNVSVSSTCASDVQRHNSRKLRRRAAQKKRNWKNRLFSHYYGPKISTEAASYVCPRSHGKPASNTETEASHRSKMSKATPPNQVFIAGIPDGFDGAEDVIFGLVNNILRDFKFVPESAKFPCKIKVCGDYAFVEFSSEAVAGIFLDAYHADKSSLSIHGQQLTAARSRHLMKLDAELRQAIGEITTGRVLIPNNVLYLGNVPHHWKSKKKLACHITTIIEEATAKFSPESISVYTFSGFPDVYVEVASNDLADIIMYRCTRKKEHLDRISRTFFLCRSSGFLPKGARVHCLSAS